MFRRSRSRFAPMLPLVVGLILTACGDESPDGLGPDLYAKHGGGPKPLLVYIDPSSFPATFAIDGASFSYTVIAENPSREVQDVWMSLDVEQGPEGTPTAGKVVDGFFLDCGAGEGVVPARSTCTQVRSGVVVSNAAVGHGTLVPGTARLNDHFYQGTGTKIKVISEGYRVITLTAP
jgi:hypothetical protein